MKKKLASMAIAGLAVTAFAACGDDDGGDTPSEDTSLTGDTGATEDTGATDVTTAETMAPVTTAGG